MSTKKNVVDLKVKKSAVKSILSNRSTCDRPLNPLSPAPEYMDDDAKEIYQELLDLYAERPGTLEVDKYALQIFADSLSAYRSIKKMMNKSGELIRNKQGNLVSTPLRYGLNGERSALMATAVQMKATLKSRVIEEAPEETPVSVNVSEDF